MMSASRQVDWTVDSFLAREARQECRWEFGGLQPVGMPGGAFEHDAIQVNRVAALHGRLARRACRVHGDSRKIRVVGSIGYPDAFVTCTPIARGATPVAEPVVIFEGMSPITVRTARTDRTVKNREYAGAADVRRYIMLEQTAQEGTMFTRSVEGDDWVGHILPPDNVIRLAEIGIELPLAEIYAGLDFSGDVAGEDS